jgi:RNA polymerase sigma-70 factor (ECF subfamily)
MLARRHIPAAAANYPSAETLPCGSASRDLQLNGVSDRPDASRGRTGEFVQLLTGAQSRLYAYVCTLVGEAAGARDVLQETNLALWDKAREYDPGRPFMPWAYRVAYLQVLAHRKRYARSRLVFDEQLVRELAERVAERHADLDLRLEALGRCIEQLSGDRREMVDRRYQHGESVEEISRRLRKTPNVVAANLYRIRKALLSCIESRLAAG